jgi:hypothetical protein
LPIFAVFLDLLSPHCQPLFFLFFIFILKKSEFWGITQNWVMTVAPLFTMLAIESLVKDFR